MSKHNDKGRPKPPRPGVGRTQPTTDKRLAHDISLLLPSTAEREQTIKMMRKLDEYPPQTATEARQFLEQVLTSAPSDLSHDLSVDGTFRILRRLMTIALEQSNSEVGLVALSGFFSAVDILDSGLAAASIGHSQQKTLQQKASSDVAKVAISFIEHAFPYYEKQFAQLARLSSRDPSPQQFAERMHQFGSQLIDLEGHPLESAALQAEYAMYFSMPSYLRYSGEQRPGSFGFAEYQLEVLKHTDEPELRNFFLMRKPFAIIPAENMILASVIQRLTAEVDLDPASHLPKDAAYELSRALIEPDHPRHNDARALFRKLLAYSTSLAECALPVIETYFDYREHAALPSESVAQRSERAMRSILTEVQFVYGEEATRKLTALIEKNRSMLTSWNTVLENRDSIQEAATTRVSRFHPRPEIQPLPEVFCRKYPSGALVSEVVNHRRLDTLVPGLSTVELEAETRTTLERFTHALAQDIAEHRVGLPLTTLPPFQLGNEMYAITVHSDPSIAYTVQHLFDAAHYMEFHLTNQCEMVEPVHPDLQDQAIVLRAFAVAQLHDQLLSQDRIRIGEQATTRQTSQRKEQDDTQTHPERWRMRRSKDFVILSDEPEDVLEKDLDVSKQRDADTAELRITRRPHFVELQSALVQQVREQAFLLVQEEGLLASLSDEQQRILHRVLTVPGAHQWTIRHILENLSNASDPRLEGTPALQMSDEARQQLIERFQRIEEEQLYASIFQDPEITEEESLKRFETLMERLEGIEGRMQRDASSYALPQIQRPTQTYRKAHSVHLSVKMKNDIGYTTNRKYLIVRGTSAVSAVQHLLHGQSHQRRTRASHTETPSAV